MTTREFNYPVFGTQGGGLVREVNGKFIFIEKPNCPGLDVGDEMPAEWDYQPANELARSQLQDEEFPFLSVPWDKEKDGVAAFEKMPDRYGHWH